MTHLENLLNRFQYFGFNGRTQVIIRGKKLKYINIYSCQNLLLRLGLTLILGLVQNPHHFFRLKSDECC